MDFNALVEEIVSRVVAKLEEAPAIAEAACVCDDKPGLLILTQEHGDHCHSLLESSRLLEYYHTDCALLRDYQVDIANYEAVILYTLSCDALARLAGGVCDTPFTALAQKAILMGKKIFVPREAVELYQYKQTAPSAYYQMLREKLRLLEQAGVIICPQDCLEDAILTGEIHQAACASAPVPIEQKAACGEASIAKKVITEKDISLVCSQGVGVLHVAKKAIVTDLAREYAHTRRVTIMRDC